MSEHTIGPWEACGADAQGSIIIVANECFVPHAVASVHQCEDDDAGDYEANARLIAAAPELLAACKELIAALHSPKDVELDSSWLISAANNASAAISKAEGA